MKEPNSTIWDMVKVSFTITKVGSILVNGNKIKWMVKVFFTIPITKSPTMESGKTINFGVKEPSIMNKLVLSTIRSITEIGTMLTNIGSNTKDNFRKTVKMVRASSTCQMGRSLKEVSKMTWFGEKALFYEEMVVGWKEFGDKTN